MELEQSHNTKVLHCSEIKAKVPSFPITNELFEFNVELTHLQYRPRKVKRFHAIREKRSQMDLDHNRIRFYRFQFHTLTIIFVSIFTKSVLKETISNKNPSLR